MASWSDGGQIFPHISVAKACGSPCNEIDATPISQSDRDLVPPDKPVVDTNVILRSFRNLSEQDIYDLIQKSAKKVMRA